MPTLLMTAGPAQGQYFPLHKSRLITVGRDDQCNIQIVDDQVSRRHLQIRFEQEEDRHYAVDMRSANGVFVNGWRITHDTGLQDGDVIQVGQSTLCYSTTDFPDAESAWEHYKKTGEWKRSTIVKGKDKSTA